MRLRKKSKFYKIKYKNPNSYLKMMTLIILILRMGKLILNVNIINKIITKDTTIIPYY